MLSVNLFCCPLLNHTPVVIVVGKEASSVGTERLIEWFAKHTHPVPFLLVVSLVAEQNCSPKIMSAPNEKVINLSKRGADILKRP